MDILAEALAAAEKNGESRPEFGRLLDGRGEIVANGSQREIDEWRLAVGRAIEFLQDKTKGKSKCR
jgi:hypothetical protein